MLEVADLRFAYNGLPVLHGVSFQLERGQILAVLGVNGAGKTTLLKCLNGLLASDAGSIRLDGIPLGRLGRTERAMRIGYVPQRLPDSQLTVFDAVLLGRRPHIRWASTARDLEITRDVLRLLALEPLALRPLSRLSGGELQRAMIGRALAQQPELLLLDEPTSSLDLRNQLEVLALLREAARVRGLALVVAIHDLNTALRFADLFLLLRHGRVAGLTPRAGMTPEALRSVFGVNVLLGEVKGHPVVVPVPSAA